MSECFGMTTSENKRQNNVKIGYELVAEAIDYLANKLYSIRDGEEEEDDDQVRILRNELVKQELDESIESFREKARRLREYYRRPEPPTGPPAGSKESITYIKERAEEQDFVRANRGLICIALQLYGHDLSQATENIATQVIIRKPSAEDLKAFLSMKDVDKQLRLIDESMTTDYKCENNVNV